MTWESALNARTRVDSEITIFDFCIKSDASVCDEKSVIPYP